MVVADSFGGRLAVVDSGRGSVESVRPLPAHNIRGLALSRDQKSVLIAHQQIPHKAVASYDGVHWGRIVNNAVEVLDVAKLLQADPPQRLEGWLNNFGDVGSATADPGEVITGENGLVAVALTGVVRLTLKVSVLSGVVSPLTATVMVCERTPGANVSVPDAAV